MKRFVLGFGLLTGLLTAGNLTQGERDFAMSNLHVTRKLFLDSVAGLTPAQWNYKPAPDRWSIAECAEHIVVTEELLTGMARKAIQGKAEPEKKLPADQLRAKEEKIIAAMPDRSQKFKAPESIQPAHRFKSPAEIVARFRQLRDANIDYLDKTGDDLRVHFLKHPVLGEMDAYQWYLLMSEHAERHTRQIQEVKADAGYPR